MNTDWSLWECERCGDEPCGYNNDGELICSDCFTEWFENEMINVNNFTGIE